MALEVEGRLKRINPLETGVSQSSGKEWKKQIFIITTLENYSKTIAFTTWGDTTEQLKNLKVGDRLRVYFNVESREFNNKWYTDAVAWKIVKIVEEDLSRVGGSSSAAMSPEDIIYGTGSSQSQAMDENPLSENDLDNNFDNDLMDEATDEDDMPF